MRSRVAVRRSALRRAAAMWLCGALVVVGTLSACTAENRPHDVGSSGVAEPSNFTPGPADRSGSADSSIAVTTLVHKLEIPWGVTFLPGGAALVTERHSLRILRVGPGYQPTGDLTVTRVATITEADPNNEGGLLGIAASPNFGRDNTVFIYYTSKVDNRIAKLRLGGRPQPIVTGIPHAGVHNGGRLAFGPDGYLYATTGDASRANNAQHVDDLGGKILRMTTDGKPAPGNPFRNSLVWSYGHRNPEGIAWDRAGHMYAAEIGESLWDELNLIQPGKNYGWPEVEGMGGGTKYVDPLVAWRPEVGVSAGVAILGHTAVVSCLRGQRIYLVKLDGHLGAGGGDSRAEGGSADRPNLRWRPGAGVAERPVEALAGKYGRIRTAIAAPDGSIWLTTSNRDGRNDQGATPEDDRILRLTIAPEATPTG